MSVDHDVIVIEKCTNRQTVASGNGGSEHNVRTKRQRTALTLRDCASEIIMSLDNFTENPPFSAAC